MSLSHISALHGHIKVASPRLVNVDFRGEIFNMADRPRRLVKAPKRFSCDFSAVSRNATNAKKEKKVA